MKILYITSGIEGTDGWSRYSHDLIQEALSSGHEVQNLVLGSPLLYLVNPLRIFKLSRYLNKKIMENKPEIVHFLVEPYANAAAFLNIPNIKIIMTVHGTFSYIPNLMESKFKKVISKWFFSRTYKKLYKVIAVSQYTATHLKKSMIKDFGKSVDVEKIVVINNGVDLKKVLKPNLAAVNSQSGLKKFLFVGSVKPRKGLMETIRILALYRDKYGNNFTFDIAGDAAHKQYLEQLKNEVHKYHLDKNIDFLGRVNEQEKENLYKEADAFIMLSIEEGNAPEGFGLVYLEANAYGVPALGSRNSGAEDAIKDGYSGYLVSPSLQEEVVHKLHSLLSNLEMRNNARKWAEEHEISKVAQKIIELYK
jgi:phosphatidylinositol alpha-1,6-mannosyltransferase